MSYTRVPNANVIYETTAAYKFTLGDDEHWIPKSQSKLEGVELYILTWVYQKNFKGPKPMTQPVQRTTPVEPDAIDRLTELLREALAILRTLR